MAAPSYTEDLTDVDLAESTTGWSAYGGGASGLDQNADISMQGVYCVGKQISNADKGQYFDNGTGITLGTGDHVWVWHFCGTPGLTNTIQNKGASIYIGTGSAAYCQYHVEGNDTYGASGRVARCYPIDYSVRTANTSPPYRTVSGTPGANPQLFGGGLVTTATVKGFNLGIDAIRYGTGAYLTAGELISAGDASDNPCTFAGFATVDTYNDATNGYNRWAIFMPIGGGYELQGTFAIGQNNAGTATLCRFKDSDRSIALVDTIHSSTTFTKIIIDHASTRCEWTNINISALGTHNKGSIDVTSNDPVFIVNGGTWTGIGQTTLQSNSDIDGTTWRDAGKVTTNTGTIINALFDSCSETSSTQVTGSNLNQVTDSHFIKGANTNHAFELTGAAGSYTWSNTASGYTTGSTGNGVQITGGSITGNEHIHITATTGTFNISVAAGATIPSVSSAGAIVNVTANQVTLTISPLIANTEVRIYSHGTTTELAGVENSGTSFDYIYTYAAGTYVDIVVHKAEYEYIRIDNYLLGSANATLPVQQVLDRNYSNP